MILSQVFFGNVAAVLSDKLAKYVASTHELFVNNEEFMDNIIKLLEPMWYDYKNHFCLLLHGKDSFEIIFQVTCNTNKSHLRCRMIFEGLLDSEHFCVT